MNDIVRPFLSDETGREINETLGQIRDILLRDETTAEKKDVSFYDYDGTLLYSYTVEEANALTALPAGPAHEGLVFDDWNWSLEDVKSLTRPMDIGAMFATDDGTTRIYIRLEERTNPRFGLCVNGTVTIDWGDGTAYDTLTGTDLTVAQQTPVHNYAFPGDYVIKLAINGEAQITESFYAPKNKWFKNSISKIEIGTNIAIGEDAFYNCYSLSNITIPSNITSLGEYAFGHCHSLLSVTIPSRVETFEEGTFIECLSLLNITIPKSITYLNGDVFRGCASLQSITLPNLITEIGSYNFQGCSSLSNIIVPVGVTAIRESAFQGCFSLSSIIIPDTVTSIGECAFQDCISLSSVIISDNSQIKSIGIYAFANCDSLLNIIIPNQMTTIQGYTFYRCSSLLDIIIPNGIQSIGQQAFFNCNSLLSVTFPNGLATIGAQAFDFCGEVTYYDFTQLSSIPTLTHSSVLGNLNADYEIRVPASLETQWKAATNWTIYADHIVGV